MLWNIKLKSIYVSVYHEEQYFLHDTYYYPRKKILIIKVGVSHDELSHDCMPYLFPHFHPT